MSYKGHETALQKRDNRDYLTNSDDYNSEGMITFSGTHRIQKGSSIEIETDSGFKLFDSYYLPNSIESFNFPKKNLLITKANKVVFNHITGGIEKKFDYEIPQIEVNLRELAKNEKGIIGVNIKPKTANCDTIVSYGTNVNDDEKIKEIIDNNKSFLVYVMMKVTVGGKEVTISITVDCGVIIYKYNDNLKDDLDIIFYVYNTIISKYKL